MTIQSSATIGVEGPMSSEASLQPARTRSATDVLSELWLRVQERGITALCLATSIAALFGFWYLGTKYRFEFYIRFKNVPTPGEVLQQALDVTGSSKFLVNVGNSLRRILSGFALATLLGVSLGVLIGKYQRVRDL